MAAVLLLTKHVLMGVRFTVPKEKKIHFGSDLPDLTHEEHMYSD
jgi:hypothetical protein